MNIFVFKYNILSYILQLKKDILQNILYYFLIVKVITISFSYAYI